MKYNPNERVQNHTAMLVANGYAEKYGVYYFETFSLASRFETIEMLLCIVAQYDVKSPFLNSY